MQVGSLAKPQNRFKVDVNASENHLTGAAIVTDDFCIVVVEGGAHVPRTYVLAARMSACQRLRSKHGKTRAERCQEGTDTAVHRKCYAATFSSPPVAPCQCQTTPLPSTGAKGHKRYKRLMLQRIDWAAPPDDDAEPTDAAPPNYCDLVWEGSVQKPAFERFSVEVRYV